MEPQPTDAVIEPSLIPLTPSLSRCRAKEGVTVRLEPADESQSGYPALPKGLAKSDQLAIDDLFIDAGKHVAEAAYAPNQIPMELFMVAMLLEMHREVMELRTQINETRNLG